jgi:hypothetical protein
MNAATANLTNDLTRTRSLAALLGTAAVAVAALGVTSAPASAKPTQACGAARARLTLDQRFLDWAHAHGDQGAINFYRSQVFDDQIAILDNC